MKKIFFMEISNNPKGRSLFHPEPWCAILMVPFGRGASGHTVYIQRCTYRLKKQHLLNKMIVFQVALIFLFLTNIIHAADTNDWERDGLKGRVKEFIEKNYSIEYRSKKSIKKLVRKVISKYDSIGKRIEAQEYRYGIFFDKYIHRFNNTGNRVLNTKYIPDKNYEKTTNYKDKNVKYVVTNRGNASFYSKDIYKYDKNKNLIEWASYKSDNTLYSKYIYKYNKDGNITEDTFYNIGGSLKWKNIYKYDKKNNMIKKSVYKYDSLYSEYTFKYDKNKNMIIENKYVIKKEDGKNKLYIS